MSAILDREMMRRINKRAHQLSSVAYEDFKVRMLEDKKVRTGQTKPEDWQPLEHLGKVPKL